MCVERSKGGGYVFWDYLREQNRERLARLNLPSTDGQVKMLIFDVDAPYTLDIIPDMKIIFSRDDRRDMHGTMAAQVAKLVYFDLKLYGSAYRAKEIENIIDYAISNNIKIISASMTFTKTKEKEAALKRYYDWGGVFVASAGNDGGKSVRYPGSSPYTICISATDSEDCNGPEIDVTADSNWFVRNKNSRYYHSFNGTSASTPVIAGCVAHIIARYPEWDCEDVRAYLHENSTTNMKSLEEHERFFSFPDDFGKEELELNNPEYIIIHHSGTKEGDAETFRKNHIEVRGWRDIGYHYVINNGTYQPDGLIETGRTEAEDGAHCSADGMNRKSIGICLVGNFDIDKPTPAQMEALERLCMDIIERHKIPVSRVLGHGEVKGAATNCPGKNFDMVEFRKRLEGGKVAKDYEGHWAQQYIEKAVNTGYMTGYPDGTFKPDNPITRAEFARVLSFIIDKLERR
jgi:N-acetylmuramoyl-L-alanine amidase